MNQRLLLEVWSGPDAGLSYAVEAGETAVVGRMSPCEFLLPNDMTVSRRHFSVSFDGREGRILDLGSSHGTTLNGGHVEEAALGSGDLIGAGTTMIRVRVTTAAVPRPVASADLATADFPTPAFGAAEEGPAPSGRVLAFLRSQARPLFLILDAARRPEVLIRIDECPDQKGSLYEGRQAVEMAQVAPYLVSLPKTSPFLDRLIAEAWGNCWGIFLTSEAPFEAVRRHLRRFLVVDLPGKGRHYFRFYDPRVLRTHLPSCTVESRAEFFGPIDSYLIEDDDAAVVLAWRHPREGRNGPESLRV